MANMSTGSRETNQNKDNVSYEHNIIPCRSIQQRAASSFSLNNFLWKMKRTWNVFTFRVLVLVELKGVFSFFPRS